jgi:hypothetical protein
MEATQDHRPSVPAAGILGQVRALIVTTAMVVPWAACLYAPRPLDSHDGPSADAAIDAPPGSSRVTDGLIALWQLDENGGTTIGDSSGLAPIVISIADPANVSWSPDALSINAAVDINSGFGETNRLSVTCKATDEVTLEAWVTPGLVEQIGTTAGQPARIITMTSQNASSHQISLGQLGSTWAGQVRTSAAGIDAHGGPALTEGTVEVRLTHLVLTSNASERRLYVDGVMVSDTKGGTLDAWEQMRTVSVAGDPGRHNTWRGTIHLAAMYDRALASDEVMANFAAGKGP